MAEQPRTIDPEDDETPSVRAFIWVLFGFKLATVALIFWHLRTWQTGLLLGATTWYFVPVIILLVGGPVLFQFRLRRVRARRAALQRAEWMLDDGRAVDDHANTKSRR